MHRWDAAYLTMHWNMLCMRLQQKKKVNEIFKKRLNGESISREEEMIFKTAFMQFVGKEYQKKELGNADPLWMQERQQCIYV